MQNEFSSGSPFVLEPGSCQVVGVSRNFFGGEGRQDVSLHFQYGSFELPKPEQKLPKDARLRNQDQFPQLLKSKHAHP
jgi:hypothetical protein